MVTGKVKEATIQRKEEVVLGESPTVENKIYREKDCIYVEALNMKNAIKKITKYKKPKKTYQELRNS